MRRLVMLALVFLFVFGVNCLPPGDDPITEPVAGDAAVDEQVSDAEPEGPRCHSGTFECADGPTVAACGTWYFDVNEGDALVGRGEITAWLPNTPITLTLTGTVDSTSETIEITITSAEDGNGVMRLGYVGPTLELVGDWSFANGPEPEGIEVSGQATGVSCQALP